MAKFQPDMVKIPFVATTVAILPQIHAAQPALRALPGVYQDKHALGIPVTKCLRQSASVLSLMKRNPAGGETLAARKRAANRYYSGPPSDHFDGTLFFNPNGKPPARFSDLLK
ncbi:MAG: hypothetical protein E5V27_12110, partial [Mesorhizobium sp.]